MSDEIDWTAEELLAEIRSRERARVAAVKRAAAGPGMRATAAVEPPRGATGVVPRFRNIAELSTAELAKLLNARQRAIYGVDDRKDVKDITDKRHRALAEASVALVEAADLQQAADGSWTLKTTSFKTEYDLCSNEPFASQPLGCFCSGVLVGADVIATAGHCVKNTGDLGHIRFVFGFRMVDAQAARTTFAADDVYEGREVIGRALSETGTDWALVRLARKVIGRKPVAFRTSGKIAGDEPLFVIGHPCGLPQKFAGGARVVNNASKTFFAANLDTYGGNSGSPVFSARTLKVEGLLVRGQTDFVSNGECNVSTVFPSTGSGGEDVTRATVWAARVAPARKPKIAGGTAAAAPKSRRRAPGTRKTRNARRG